MKKILFLLVLIYSFSNALTISEMAGEQYSINFSSTFGGTWNTTTPTTPHCGGWIKGGYLTYQRMCYSGGQTYAYNAVAGRYGYTGSVLTTTAKFKLKSNPNEPNTCSENSVIGTNSIYLCNASTGDYNEVANPDPIGGGQCRDLFQKDGVAYTCNPNSNEATPIPNSNGTILDPESPNGNDKPNCNVGYEAVGTMTIAGGGNSSYNTWTCVASAPTGGDTGNTSGTGGTGEPSISYGGDGSVTMTLPDGTKQTTYGDGWVTTTYPDGSTSSTPPRTGNSGGSSGGSGTSGGGTGGTSGNTTNEDNTTPTTDTPIDNTPVANACTDSALTLQERMLCELNAGMKKQNSEGAPQNSLNQLLKDLKASNQTDNTAINTNLKDVVSGTTQLVNKQTQANTTLDKINDSLNSSELNSESMNFGINKISGTLDGIAEFVTTISDFVKDPSQIGDLMNNKLGEVANKYQTGIMNDSSCGVCPTISIPYHGTNVTLLNQTLLDTYFPIAMMKTIIILTFAFAGFMNFFRSSN